MQHLMQLEATRRISVVVTLFALSNHQDHASLLPSQTTSLLVLYMLDSLLMVMIAEIIVEDKVAILLTL